MRVVCGGFLLAAGAVRGTAAAATSPAAATAGAPRFVVVQATSTPQIPSGTALDAAVKELGRRAFVVVPGAALRPEERACATEPCLRALLARTGATHVLVLRFNGPDANEQSDGEVTVFASHEPSVYEARVRDTFSLPGVFTARLAEAAADLAGKVVSRAGAGPVTGTGPVPTPGSQLDEGSSARSTPTWQRVLPWALVGAGAASVAVGVAWLVSNGERACAQEPCRQIYDTRTSGWAFVGAGAAVAAVGAGWALTTRQPTERDVALVTDLRSWSLRGTF